MALALLLLPAALALLSALAPWPALRPWFLPLAAVAHFGLTLACLAGHQDTAWAPWLVLDAPGRLVLLVISTLFLACAVYAVGYLRLRRDWPNRTFVACLLAFLTIASLVCFTTHLALAWVCMEASTLATAPLIYFNHNARSIEATWKYLLVCSVGIALALLGTFFLAYAALHAGLKPTLFIQELAAQAPRLSKSWLHGAFVLLLVGYGSKMGLAPMHAWKPDAYGEAPGMVGTLLAGGLTSCAFLTLARIQKVYLAAGEGGHTGPVLIFMGLLSMAVAGAFMVGQRDFKRLLAYSSVEHMGILVLGLGIGGAGAYAAMLHLVNNALTKGVLFLSAGNIHRAYGSKSLDKVQGALRRLPLSGALFLFGFLAITGSPPFAPFWSEFYMLNAAFGGGHWWAGGLYLGFLMLAFVGMGATVLAVVLGPAPEGAAEGYRDSFATGAPLLVLMALVLGLGLWIPAPLGRLVQDAALFLEPRP